MTNSVFWLNPHPPRLCSINIDITDRKLAEEKLQESNEKYIELIELGTEAIFLIDNQTCLTLEAIMLPQKCMVTYHTIPRKAGRASQSVWVTSDTWDLSAMNSSVVKISNNFLQPATTLLPP